jgi:hypothetical protein
MASHPTTSCWCCASDDCSCTASFSLEPGIKLATLPQGGVEAEVTAAALAAAAPLVTSLSTLGALCCSCSPKRLIDLALTAAERVTNVQMSCREELPMHVQSAG